MTPLMPQSSKNVPIVIMAFTVFNSSWFAVTKENFLNVCIYVCIYIYIYFKTLKLIYSVASRKPQLYSCKK